jgi:hypothetical protein
MTVDGSEAGLYRLLSLWVSPNPLGIHAIRGYFRQASAQPAPPLPDCFITLISVHHS